jgi:hypothetical protein
MDSFIDFKTLIERLKIILEITTDTIIAEKLQLSYQSFAQMKRRNSLPYENLLILCNKRNLNPLILLNENNEKFTKYCNDIRNLNAYSDKINIINSDKFIVIPGLNTKSSYKAYIDVNNDINIIDTNDTMLSHNQTYIIEKNDIYYKKHITIDINGNYILSETNIDDWIVSKKELNQFNSIAKVIFSYSRSENNNYEIVQNKITKLIAMALNNEL